jgi:selenophosphate synthetase-related protein
MYPGMGFVVTAKSEDAERVLEVFLRRGLTAKVIGKVTADRRLIIRRGLEEAVLFDLTRECVTGIH